MFKEENIEFVITREMVNKFSFLCGDNSSLHMDEVFARRSMYRQCIVHGLLPLMFISSYKGQVDRSRMMLLKKISANFLKPVMFGELLVLNMKPQIEQEEHEYLFDFSIKNKNNGTACVQGNLVFTTIKKESTHIFYDTEGSKSILVDALEERELFFEDIKKADGGDFKIKLAKEHKRDLLEILRLGKQDINARDRQVDDNCILNEFLAMSLVSTFAGMCIPGKTATILNFCLDFLDLVEEDLTAVVVGKVIFKSSLGTISENICLNNIEGTKKYFDCKMNIKVNKDSIKMIDSKKIKDEMLDFGLKDKVALITGSSRGIGETTAKLFAMHGCKVVVNYFKGRDDAEKVVADIRDAGGIAMAVQADVVDGKQVEEMVNTVIKEFGTIDILINNAVRDFSSIKFSTLEWDEIQKDIDVIVKGAFNCCKKIIPIMSEKKWGRIINISSIATDVPPKDQLKYVMSKAALEGLSRGLASDFASKNILVNVVVPNMVKTDLTVAIADVFVDKIARGIPLGRICSSIDVAKACLFLASSLAEYSTGQRIMVTGGEAPFL